MRRPLLALTLLAVTGIAGIGAAEAESDDGAVPVVGAPSPRTPVLSARRAPTLLAAPAADRHLRAALDGILSGQPGASCLSVTASGRPIYTARAEQPLVPASLAKLVTAMAALEVLGPDHRFRTAVVAAAPPEGGVVAGDLWLVGGGDPVLATTAYAARFENQPQVLTPVESLADAVAAAGVVRVDGRLLGDGSRYDADRYPDPWPARFVDQDQSGPLSALSVNDGWAAFPPSPDVRTPDEAPAADPDLLAADVLAGLLGGRAVTVAGTGTGAAPPGAVEIAAVESPPLSEIVGQLLRESDNQTGELLAKELAVASGRPPTTADGVAVITETATGLGLPMGGVVLVDGSGLAEDNQLSCALLTAVLDRAGPDGAIADGLPVAGESGTLAERFVDSPVSGRLRAKTGTLNQVTALAGYLRTTPGADLSFALMVNLAGDDRVDADDLARQEALATVLDRYPEGPSLEELGPQPVAAPAAPEGTEGTASGGGGG